ncbi:helix-turn-helix domain-containing protein [Streptomyces noursei]|uniref:helix-turn-helix domain-containing protein n=1 Tax=Streptomyces noursei TaxID=1971 RepID=UPI00081C80E2|nr:transcriptional regulator [Streptomyces noursei ATCC 11455]ANZ21910.1 transcriptional regulator [Streptomyces noursei ATCC 11455]MCZ0996506.1 helix-turn-helix domain-containing protein [Streptomyces noursei]
MLNVVPDKQSPKGNIAVLRTVAVLRALQGLQKPHSREAYLREIAAATGLPSATAYRYLQALRQAGVVSQPKNYASRDASRGRYRLQWHMATEEPPRGSPSQGTRGLLVQLATQTGQIAMLYAPYSFAEQPMRECTAQVWGPHEPVRQEDVEFAPLGADAAGMAIAAAMGITSPRKEQAAELRRIRQVGFAVGPALLEGGHHDIIAAPIWRGSSVAGAVALMPLRVQMRSQKRRTDLISAVLDIGSTMSNHLTRQPLLRSAA